MRMQSPERPSIIGYGIYEGTEGLLDWSFVTERMAVARNYWVATTRPDSRPHVTPVWGVWVDGAFYFGAGTDSVKARNLAQNDSAVVHLESGDEAVILEGTIERLTEMSAALHQTIGDSYAAKYDGFRPGEPTPDAPLFVLHCQTAFAWLETDYPRTATRWCL